MPSQAAKKRQAQKKEKRQASSRSAQKRPQVQPPSEVDGELRTGSEVQLLGQNGGSATVLSDNGGASAFGGAVNEVTGSVGKLKLSPRSCTGE